MRNRIYFENSLIALKAEKECNELAKSKGFSDWNQWYKQEKKSEEFIKDLESFKEMMRITDKYEKEAKGV